MKNSRKCRLIHIEWPEFGGREAAPSPELMDMEKRIELTRSSIGKEEISHLIVYADRDHFANLTFLTGFDPRYEEAVLILGQQRSPLILVGNECADYLNVSPLFRAGKMRSERFQSLSLLDQPRDSSRFLRDIFLSEGINDTSRVGCVGWKYFAGEEHPAGKHAIEIPAYIVDTLREIVGYDRVVNATHIFMNPEDGLRTFCSPFDIAYFEYTGTLASEGMRRMLTGMKDGIVDYELAKLMQYSGVPFANHMTILTQDNIDRSLTSPTGALLKRGKPFLANINYWGTNCCRAGWIAESEKDLPALAADYVEKFAGIYFEVMAEWFSLLKIGASAGKLYTLIQEHLPFETFRIFLNPAHLFHLDEWLSSPFKEGSNISIHSGMAIQSDVIPNSDIYFSTRMEDGYIVADESLRKNLKRIFPDTYTRCLKRREFMIEVLGIEISEEVLPLSNIAGIVPPYFLQSNLVFSMEN
jgi:hypothetical protein